MPNIAIPNNPNALQQAIEKAQPGDVLVLPNDGVYGPLQLPPRHLGGVVVSSQDFSAKSKPVIASDSQQVWPCQSDFGSGGVTFQGLTFRNTRKDATDNPSAVVALGQNSQHLSAKRNEELTSDVAFVRCNIEGVPLVERTMHGVILNAVNARLSGCNIQNIVHGNAESHGVYLDDTLGPVYIEDSVISASGVNILCGGGSPNIPGQRVCERGLFVRRNYISKQIEWSKRPAEVGVKNLLELKNCWLAVIEWNTLESCWSDNQDGSAVLFTPREHNPAMYGQAPRPAPLTRLGDILFARNTMSNISGAFNISGSDDLGIVSQTERIRIWGNTIMSIGSFKNPTGRAINVNGVDRTKPIRELDIRWNRFGFNPTGAKSLLTFQGVPASVGKLVFEANVFDRTTYGIFATGGNQSARALDEHCLTGSWSGNDCMDDFDPNVCDEWKR